MRRVALAAKQRCVLQRAASTASTAIPTKTITRPPLLLRDFIQESLYDPHHGYFTTKASIISHGFSESKFRTFVQHVQNLKNRGEYLRYISSLFKSNDWRTPSELFGPLYVNPIANCIIKKYRSEKSTNPLKIVEYGAGFGSCALHMLNFLKENYPSIYANTSYTVVDITPTFVESLSKSIGALHPAQFNAVLGSCFDYEEKYDLSCFVVALELLDNLPHDRVIRRGPQQLYETRVKDFTAKSGNRVLEFLDSPLRDPLITDYIRRTSCISQYHREVFVPTQTIAFLKNVLTNMPKAHMVLSDFEFFPEEPENNDPNFAYPRKNRPSVHATINGKTKIYSSIMRAPKYGADIYFPTNFSDLSALYKSLSTSTATSEVYRHSEFMKKFGDKKVIESIKTLDGYNPLLTDYDNTKFFIS